MFCSVDYGSYSSAVLPYSLDFLPEEQFEEAPVPEKVRSTKYFRSTYTKEGKSAEEKVRKQTRLAAAAPNNRRNLEGCFSSEESPQLRLDPSVKIAFDNSQSWQDGRAGLAIKQGRSDEDVGCYKRIDIEIEGQSYRADFYAIFDGHGDKNYCSFYLELHFPLAIQRYLSDAAELNEDTITQAITMATKDMEEATVEKLGGTTATCALKIEDKIYVINVGDSRAILVKEGEVCQLTEDADLASERFLRALNNMGREVVICDGIPRVDGRLAMARDIGNEFVSAQPKITRISLDAVHSPEEGLLSYHERDYLVFASDGIWDVMSNDDVAQAIRVFSKEERSAEVLAQLLVQEARDKWEGLHFPEGFIDDISALIVKLGSKK